MSRWINVVLVYILLGAVLLIATRALLPIIRLGGMAEGLDQPLANLTPILLAISLAAITLITFNLRRQTRLAKKLSEEAEILGAESIIGDVESPSINMTAGANPSLNNGLKPESLPERSKNHQADDRNGSSNGRSSWHSPTFTTAPEGESLGVAAAAAGAATDKARGENRQAAPATVRDLSLALSEDRASKRSENKNKVSSADDDVFSRYRHLIESPFSPMATSFYQLPPPLPEFVGRSAELVELYAARANHDVRVLSVQGPGGAGKTTLALKLADQLKALYPDAQFYLDLKGSSPQPLSVIEAQSAVIRAYLPTVCLPENEVELDRLYHSALAGKRVLLLLDNAAGAQQVAPIVAPDGCITIVTSRDQIALPGTFSKQLEPLSPSEARDFLMRIVPRIEGQAARVAELCEHLPLALRLAANALLISADLRVSDYVQRMERLQWGGALSPPSPMDRAAMGAPAARPTLHPVDAALIMSYDLLVPGLQKLWRMLAVFRDTFDVSAAASIWQITPVRTNNALDRLMAYGLIERNRATGRYRLHDLTARFAETRSNEQEMNTARQRFSAHYQSVLHEADALYEQG
ncbi:MAG TPA: NB-ARC domain-containing protein, partial [Blastocatellia bacterium]|nr:NB-ARC domain-containing protein [Blastocatellia bacterium]